MFPKVISSCCGTLFVLVKTPRHFPSVTFHARTCNSEWDSFDVLCLLFIINAVSQNISEALIQNKQEKLHRNLI